MREIKKDEWIRLRNGQIRKFVKYLEDGYVELTRPYSIARTIDIIGNSKNIKEILQVGDYINGIKITNIFWDKKAEMLVIRTADRRQYYDSKIIHSVIAKEQFKRAEYRVEE